jgi:hypothetical protein
MNNVILFSFTAMANPSLLAATTVMLLLPNPQRLMLGYLAGALLTSVTVGLVIVFALKGSSAVDTAKHTLTPAADLAVGSILLLVAGVLGTGRATRFKERRSARKGAKEDKGPPRWQREISKGSPRVTFVVGMLLTLPGASYLAALTAIVKLDPEPGASVLLVLMVNVIMLALIELPSLGFAIAPDWTKGTIERVTGWFRRNGLRAAVIGAATIGTLLIVRGVITLLT